MCNIIDKFKDEYAFLSNFYPSVIYVKVENEWYSCKTVEHAFQASKTIYPKQQLEILFAETPGKAKRLGRKVVLRQDWEDIKVNVMRQYLMQKFADVELRKKLLETGNKELVEGTYWGDTFWGIDLHTGQGENVLGKLLMEERERIRKTYKGD